MRGEIRHRFRKQQINDFSGLLFGKITPTDLDGVIEYHNKAYVLFEMKYLDADLPQGQRLCLERFVRDMHRAGKNAIAIVAAHEIHDPSQDIPVAECGVREFYFRPVDGWVQPKEPYTVLELTQIFLRRVDSAHMGA